ncbi:MAG TPA: hypothetical protein VKU41_05730 [Polyangiaceae bacterium]|nr:hypothetical protein [Polyangiaceae bacterium]
MNIPQLVDELYGAFADRIGEPWSTSARDLPRALDLAPCAVPWSRVFSHEVTLGAPALFAEAMPTVPSPVVREAVLAHALAVIDAFGTDRIEDDQIAPSPAVLAVLGQARRERDRAVARVFGHTPPPDCLFSAADAISVHAIRRERSLLESGRPVDMRIYERASLDKQCAGIVASVALARAAGWPDRRCAAVRATLQNVWLGLQMADDVVDWEEDLACGGAWAVCLMKGLDPPPPSGEWRISTGRVKEHVLRSGILGAMLARAQAHMRAARRRATILGAHRLAAWSGGFEARMANLVAAELRSPGYAVRAHALSAWAHEVLA